MEITKALRISKLFEFHFHENEEIIIPEPVAMGSAKPDFPGYMPLINFQLQRMGLNRCQRKKE